MKCTTCHIEKAEEDFSQRMRLRKSKQCKVCVNKSQKITRLKYRDKILARQKAKWAAMTKEERINQNFYRYGITFAQYSEMLLKQNGVCAICFEKNQIHERLFVDHCHATGKVRGLLCHDCNSAIGFSKDNTARLRAMIAYLERGGK